MISRVVRQDSCDDLGVGALDLQPVPGREGFVEMQPDASDQVAEQVLHCETDDDGDDPGAGEQAGDLNVVE